MRRKIESERWNKDTIKLVGGVPWKVNPQDPNVDGEGMKLDVTVIDQHYRDQLRSQREELGSESQNESLYRSSTCRVRTHRLQRSSQDRIQQ